MAKNSEQSAQSAFPVPTEQMIYGFGLSKKEYAAIAIMAALVQVNDDPVTVALADKVDGQPNSLEEVLLLIAKAKAKAAVVYAETLLKELSQD